MSEKITVLVADDNNDFTTTLSNYLEKEEEQIIMEILKLGGEENESRRFWNIKDGDYLFW